jgi:hypothetical protein
MTISANSQVVPSRGLPIFIGLVTSSGAVINRISHVDLTERTDADAHENEPTCGQFSGPTECAGMISRDARIWGQVVIKGIPTALVSVIKRTRFCGGSKRNHAVNAANPSLSC